MSTLRYADGTLVHAPSGRLRFTDLPDFATAEETVATRLVRRPIPHIKKP